MFVEVTLRSPNSFFKRANEEIDRKFSTINTTERESNEIEVHRKSSLTDSEKNCDMNTSDYQYND